MTLNPTDRIEPSTVYYIFRLLAYFPHYVISFVGLS